MKPSSKVQKRGGGGPNKPERSATRKAPGPAHCAGLARVLSKLGFCSRREAWDLIQAGRVKVNASVQRDPERRVALGRDQIQVDDHSIPFGSPTKGAHRVLTSEKVASFPNPPRKKSTVEVRPSSHAVRLRCRLKGAAEDAVRHGHPWVFSDSISDQNRPGAMGELAVIFDRQDRFLAVGLYDPDSPLRIRVLHRGRPINIDETWWQSRFDQAVAKRTELLDARTNAVRLINGESDGLPGLVLDRYAGILVLKLYTAVWQSRVQRISELLSRTLGPEGIVLRLSRNVRSSFARDGFQDGQVLAGRAMEGPVIFSESGILFEADVLHGQKTGFFLDQRENRREVEQLAAGAEVLNAFSFTGGFSLYAARGGARSVASLDISPHALAGVDKNFALNRAEAAIVRCRKEKIQANAFDWLEGNRDRQFDLIVLDPPSLAKREAERIGAIRAYEKLVGSALGHLRPQGTLVAASCSAHVSTEEFFRAVPRAAAARGRKFITLKSTRHAPDHAATFPEADYLKCIYLRFES